jgi:hypothetical protein
MSWVNNGARSSTKGTTPSLKPGHFKLASISSSERSNDPAGVSKHRCIHLPLTTVRERFGVWLRLYVIVRVAVV